MVVGRGKHRVALPHRQIIGIKIAKALAGYTNNASHTQSFAGPGKVFQLSPPPPLRYFLAGRRLHLSARPWIHPLQRRDQDADDQLLSRLAARGYPVHPIQ